MRKLSYIFCALTFSTLSFAAELIPVKLGVLEALSRLDSNSSERYKAAFEGAMFYAFGEQEKKLNKCGYKYELVRGYFDSHDRLGPTQSAAELEKEQVWAIFGPRKSDDFLLATKSLNKTPMVSSMASSQQVMDLGPPYFCVYESVDTMSKSSVNVAKRENYGKTYGAIINATCTACREYEVQFDKHAKGIFAKAFTVDVAGDEPDLKEVFAKLSATPVDFILLPNNSNLSGFIISNLQKKFPNIKYVGSEGWGDGQYGFLTKYGVDSGIKGFSTRCGPSHTEMSRIMDVHSLDYHWKDELIPPNFTAFSAIEFVRTLTNDLCKDKPKTRDAFIKAMTSKPRTHFKTKLGISVYKLEAGKLGYGHVYKEGK